MKKTKTKKVVINKDYGGFSISAMAVKRMAELQNKECYFFEYNFGTKTYSPISIEDADFVYFAYSILNPNGLSDQELEKYYLDNRPKDRENPLLIQVIRELKKKANGHCANLKIVSIPADVEYTIEEYDGREWIAEAHRTWS